MDVHDVSNTAQYMQLLQQQRAALKAAEARTGQLPTNMKSRKELVNEFEMMAMQTMFANLRPGGGGDTMIRSSFVPAPYPPCTTSLAELKPALLKDLRIGVHHRGRYLLARAITMPNVMTAIMAVIEDEGQNAIILQLYQQQSEKLKPATAIISKDDVFLIKEPYLKIMGDGQYGLRIDQITDILRLDIDHVLYPSKWKPQRMPISKSAEAWKEEGNLAIKDNQPWLAIEKYSLALESNPTSQEETVISLNRALAYLQDGNFEGALEDTQYSAGCFDNNEKAMFRAGRALYGLGKFDKSCEILSKMCEKYPANSAASIELDRARSRLVEEQTGVYDFESMYKENEKNVPPSLDRATYIGPLIVKDSPGRGRGLFTTHDVKAGDLLLCEKAFAHAFANSSNNISKGGCSVSLLMHTYNNRMTLGTQADLITIIVQKLLRNPAMMEEFTSLHHGDYKIAGLVDGDGKPVIDTFLIERIVSLNVFGCPVTSRASHLSTEADDKFHSCGLWMKASLINHNCVSNVRRSFIGDLQIVRATCDIPAGTELSFWYQIPTGNLKDVSSTLDHWGFSCKCTICEDLRSTKKGLLKSRNDLIKDLKVVMDNSNIDAAKAERLLKAINQTYKRPAADVPRLLICAPYLRLASFYAEKQDPIKSVSTALDALKSLGFIIRGAHLPTSSVDTFAVEKWGILTDHVVSLWIMISNAYTIFAPHLLRHSARCAKLAYKICVGEDVTFQETYDKNHELQF